METTVKRIKAFFDPHISTSIESWMKYAHHIKVVEVPNKKVIKQTGTMESDLRFILEGAGAIVVKRGRKEKCSDLCFEDEFLCDFKSLSSGEPSDTFIQNFEDITMAVLSKEALSGIYDNSVLANYIGRVLMEQQNARGQSYIESLGDNGQERYWAFAKRYPHRLSRTPLHLIASYLGVTNEWLSRIRGKHE